jgi:TolB-like protein/tetratricopeptide (TPR) repeat protein
MSESIGHYAILGLIGTGSQGQVYRARDTRVGRTVAVRLLSGAIPDPLRRSRAIHLIQPYTALSHPHVATLFEVGEHMGAIYLVHEFVPGDTLAAIIGGRPMNIRRAVDLATQVADALAETHALDLVHGAVNPGTVVVTPKGHAKVLDVGLTAWTREDDHGLTAERLSAAGGLLGPESIGYMAPEQVLGSAVDTRADLFALGAMLHEMLTGEAPFAARVGSECAVRVLQSNPAPPSTLNPAVPAGLDLIVTRALAKRPDDRYQSAATMAAELRTIASTLQVRERQEQPGGVAVATPRSRWGTVLLGGLLVFVMALAAWQWNVPIRQAWRGRFGAQPAPVLVVLPFELGGSAGSRTYYGAGFAEDLARRMGHVPGLTVLGRMSLRTYAGKAPQAAAQAARASMAVRGRVTPADEDWKSLQVEVGLVDGATGRQIWSRTYTSATQDVISLHARITRDLAGWLRVSGAATPEQGRAALRLVDPSAYDLYLQAREAMAAHDAGRAAQLYESALIADPSLIEAQTGLAEALYIGAIFDGRLSYPDVSARIRDAAEAASTTDPDFAPTQMAMGLAAPTVGAALEHLKKATSIDPSYGAAYLAMADIVREADPPRAIRLARRALQLDPAQPLVHARLAESNLMVGELNEVLVEVARGQALAPSLPWWAALRARVRLARPSVRDTEASDAGRAAVDYPPYVILRAASLTADHRRADALAMLADLVHLYPASCDAKAMTVAVRYAGGERAEAVRAADELLQAAEHSNDQMAWTRCAAMAAAAVNDAPRAATWIARAASSDDGVRWWGAINGALSGRAGLSQRIFPWAGVAGSRDVTLALARLDAALGRARADAARTLDGY